MRVHALVLALSAVLAPAEPSKAASGPLGAATAAEACEAFQSFRKRTNPGDVRLTPGAVYAVQERSQDDERLRVRVPGAPGDELRWIAAGCAVVAAAAPAAPPPTSEPGSTENVLAASWLPAFCENEGGRRECVALERGALPSAEAGFVLHGLWPQPRSRAYCGEARRLEGVRWSDLPSPRVDRETGEKVVAVMPGAASGLHRHQWAKHGSCYEAEGGADEYFEDSVWLMEQLNGSDVAVLFEAYAGDRLEPRDVRAAFDEAFGRGSGDRVEVVCGDGMIQELRLSLRGTVVAGETALADLLRAAPTRRPGCGGRVDVAGD
ncbi:MAG: ribonuclease T(2) [Pseudomonadota bacterium]